MGLLTNECPDCGHAKTQHILALDGLCAVCCGLIRIGHQDGLPCRHKFISIFSLREIEQAAAVPRTSFDQWAVCTICEAYWMEHTGMLCPNGNTLFKPLVGYV